MVGRAVIHIGAPKSGTTFVQRALWQQRQRLRDVGVHLPGDRAQDMFLAAIEVRETFEFWGRDPQALAGTWARLCAQARAVGGTTVLSHELLGAATKEQVSRALAELDGLEIHVLVTLRDIARQLISSWQEEVKNGRTTTFAAYQTKIVDKMRSSDFTGAFWRFQQTVTMLDRWGRTLPPERVHLVVAPPPGAPPGQLWARFADAVGFDSESVPVPEVTGRANQTLGIEQVAVLRRVNHALDGRIQHPEYGRVVKRRFAQRLLAAQPGTRPECPVELVEELRGYAAEVNRTLGERGYRVHGDLEELVPPFPSGDAPHPDDVTAEAEAAALAEALAELLVQQAGARDAAPPQHPPDSTSTGPADAGPKSPLPRSLSARVRPAVRRLRGR